MSRLAFSIALALIVIGQQTSNAQAGVAESFARLPLFFEPNRGQAAGDIRFVAKGARQEFFFKSNEVISVLSTESGTACLRMHWPGRVSAAVEGALPLSGKSNYLVGKNPAPGGSSAPWWIYKNVSGSAGGQHT